MGPPKAMGFDKKNFKKEFSLPLKFSTWSWQKSYIETIVRLFAFPPDMMGESRREEDDDT